jgi:hypothetical protein
VAYDPTTAVGQVRLLIGDRAEAEAQQVYADAELDAFLGLAAGEVMRAAVLTLRAWAADAAKLAVSYKLGDRAMDKREIAAAKSAAADALEKSRLAGRGFEAAVADLGFDVRCTGEDRTEYQDVNEGVV